MYHFIHGRGTPLKTGTLKLYTLPFIFLKAKFFTLIHLATNHRLNTCIISFMGGEPPYKREPWSCIVYHSIFWQRIFSLAYSWPPIIVKTRVSFHSWEGNPLINGNPEVVYFTIHFSESETFHTRTVGHQSSLKDVYHFIHGRGTPLQMGTLMLSSLPFTSQKVKVFTLVQLAGNHR